MRILLFILALFSFNACANPKRAPATQPPAQSQGGACANTLNVAQLCATLAWENAPSTKASSSLFLFFQKLETDYAPLADPTGNLKVYLWMPSMGHGSSPTTIEKVAPGVYRISRLEFIMAGSWELRFEIIEKDQSNKEVVRDQFKVDLKL